jgi:hypothetical protein
VTREHDERWRRGADRDGARRAIRFDPVVEGARHGLSRELSFALWELVREEGGTAPEQADLERAKPRFHELAAQLAAGRAKLRPDVGRLTRVAVELDGVPTARAALDALRPDVPGRETHVIVETRRWASLEPQLEGAIVDPVVSRENTAQVPVLARRTFADLVAGGARADTRAVAMSDHVQAPTTLHRSGEAPIDDAAAHGPSIAAALARRGAGDALPATLRRDMEAVLRADLSRVRVHTDAVAGTAARTIRARAFTIGADIFFAPGAFEPSSDAGRELLAHELTHVVQAQEGRVADGGGGLRISDPGEGAEREAEQVAHLRVKNAISTFLFQPSELR